MNLAYPDFSELISTDKSKVPCIVIENENLFRTFICDFAYAIAGNRTNLVLSAGEHILDISKCWELLMDFIHFDPNKKSPINKIVNELEKKAVDAEHYIEKQYLLATIETSIDKWAFDFPCDVIAGKVSVSSLLKSAGIELPCDYEGHTGQAEKILDYMELVREFDRDKLFVTVNMRTFFNDDIIEQFQKTAISHEYHVLMLESQAYPTISYENRLTIVADLCEL